MNLRLRLLGVVIVAAAAVSACGTGVEKDARYDSLEAFRDATVAAGTTCDEWEVTANDGSAGVCGGGVSLRLGAPVDKQGAALGVGMVASMEEFEPALLVGPNWAVGGPAEVIEPMQGKLGGELQDVVELMEEFTESIG